MDKIRYGIHKFFRTCQGKFYCPFNFIFILNVDEVRSWHCISERNDRFIQHHEFNNHEYLKKLFGDYMTPPPAGKRRQHNFEYLDLDTPFEDYLKKNANQ